YPVTAFLLQFWRFASSARMSKFPSCKKLQGLRGHARLSYARIRRMGFSSLLLATTGVAAWAQSAPPPIPYIKCGSLYDGRSASRRDALIAIEGDTIKEVSTTAGEPEVIDLSQETCLPGFIDTHTHVLLQGDITAADYDQQLLKQSPEYRTILA